MTVFEDTIPNEQLYYTQDIQTSEQGLSGFTAVLHGILFLGLIMSFAVPNIFGNSSANTVIRYIYFTFYIIVVFLTSLKDRVHLFGALHKLFILLSLFVSICIGATLLLLPEMPKIEFLAPFTFLLGVYIFSTVVPGVFGDRADRIIVPVIVVVVSLIILAHFKAPGRSNPLSAYSGLGGLTLLVLGFRKDMSFGRRVLCWIGTGVFCLYMFVARGRTSMVAFGMSAMVYLWFGGNFKKKMLWFSLAMVLLLLLLFSDTGNLFLEKFMLKGRDISAEGEGASPWTLSGRTIFWRDCFNAADGIVWLGKGKYWTGMIIGGKGGIHSSYLMVYFSYGIFTAISWLIMCGIGFWSALKVIKMRKGTAKPALAPVFVIYFLVLSLAESYFVHLIGSMGVFFYIGIGLCLRELKQAKELEEMSLYGELLSGHEDVDYSYAHDSY